MSVKNSPAISVLAENLRLSVPHRHTSQLDPGAISGSAPAAQQKIRPGKAPGTTRIETAAGVAASTRDASMLHILDGVDLEIRRGEAVGIVGPSGSGKTSLMMLLGGLEQPSSGKISVEGTDIRALSENGRAIFRRDTIGIVFQSFHLIPGMTALENVLVPLELAGERNAERRARAALDSVGLAARAGHRPSELSGGEQQRVALARAMVGSPRLLLADEPTGNLDPATGAHVMDLIFDLRARHDTALVLVTHDNTLAARCDRTIRMQAGRIVA